MKVLTVRQPWAGAILHSVTDPRDGTVIPAKDVENRTRNIAGAYRGPIAIHASTTFDEAAVNVAPESALGLWWNWSEFDWTYAEGVILGVVDLVDVHRSAECVTGLIPTPCSPWAEPDCVHLKLANHRPLTTPIPFRGALHLQTTSEYVEAEILRQLRVEA